MLTAAPARSRVRAFIALTKPRIIELLLVTTVPVMIVAERGLPSVALMVNTVLGGILSAAGANVFNMYADRDIDAVMARTKDRPLVTGEIEPVEALVFALVLESAAVAWLWWLVNGLAAMLALAGCLFYVFVYTLWLKRLTPQNIVIGGVAGAVPTLVGWAAVTERVELPALILFAIVIFWTPPHFWALAIKYESDYSAVSVPMMPVVVGYQKTVAWIVAYCVALLPLSVWFWQAAEMGWFYLVTALWVGVGFIVAAVRLFGVSDSELQQQRSLQFFFFSIAHLAILFFAVAVDQLLIWGV